MKIDDPVNGAFIEEPTVTVSGNVFSSTLDDFPFGVAGMTLEINTSSLELLEPDSTIPTRVDVLQLGGVSTMFVNFDQTFASGTYNTFLIGDIIQLIIGNVKPVVVGGLLVATITELDLFGTGTSTPLTSGLLLLAVGNNRLRIAQQLTGLILVRKRFNSDALGQPWDTATVRPYLLNSGYPYPRGRTPGHRTPPGQRD